MLTLAVRFYDVVTWLHVAAIVVAFGITLVSPFLLGRLTRTAPEAIPGVLGTLGWLGGRVVTPAMIVALLSGVYLATDAEVWSESWVSVPLVILIVLFGLSGAFFSPSERRLARVAARDVAEDRAAGRPVTFSEEYQRLYRRHALVGAAASALVLAALYIMIVKPFA